MIADSSFVIHFRLGTVWKVLYKEQEYKKAIFFLKTVLT